MKKRKIFDPQKCIQKLVSFSPRQLEGEDKTRAYIMSILDKFAIPYTVQKFQTRIPIIKRAKLFVDGKSITCKGCCFIGGEITGKDAIISSLISSQKFLYETNINFNPRCQNISLSNFYFAPSIAVDPKGLQKIIAGKKVFGSMSVFSQKHESANILVGNTQSPQALVFAHYDSVEKGAIDNASGVAVTMDTILSYLETLKTTLFIFSGNEELSYDQPIYWGRGFRIFEKKYPCLMQSARRIYIVDCVGNGKTMISQDAHTMPLAFPIQNIQKWKKKIFFLYGDLEGLMRVYHSDLDMPRGIQGQFLKDAKKTLVSCIQSLRI